MIPSNLNRCRLEILESNKQTRESTALSVAYNVERWHLGWEGIVGRRWRIATWTYPYTLQQHHLQHDTVQVLRESQQRLHDLQQGLICDLSQGFAQSSRADSCGPHSLCAAAAPPPDIEQHPQR